MARLRRPDLPNSCACRGLAPARSLETESRDAGHLRPMERKTLVAFCDCGVDVSDSVGRSGGAEGGAGGRRAAWLVSWV